MGTDSQQYTRPKTKLKILKERVYISGNSTNINIRRNFHEKIDQRTVYSGYLTLMFNCLWMSKKDEDKVTGPKKYDD